jgi:hypothetical protein
MNKYTKIILDQLYDNHKPETLDRALEVANREEDFPAICVGCEAVYETGFEPDQDAGWCEDCQGNLVKSILILEGLI